MSDPVALPDVFELARNAVCPGLIEEFFSSPGAEWVTVKGRKNYKTVSPLRSDHSIGSFFIRDDGVYYDYAGGTEAEMSGDFISLVSRAKGIALPEAAALIAGVDPHDIETPYDGHKRDRYKEREPKAPKATLEIDWVEIPDDWADRIHPATKPDYITEYFVNEKRAVLIMRWNAGTMYNGKKLTRKLILPFYWTGSVFEQKWPVSMRHRPLAPFDRTKTVVIVEGEKCYEELRKSYPLWAWTTWHGGANVSNRIDTSTLVGCEVILWPDNDQPGEKAAATITDKILTVAASVKRVSIPVGKPLGWDSYDAMAEGMEIERLLESAVPVQGVDLDTPAEVLFDKPNPMEYHPLTDAGNGERFLDMWKHIVRYNSDKNRWMLWKDGLWSDKYEGYLLSLAKEMIRTFGRTDNRQGTPMFALKSESARSINSFLDLARRDYSIRVREEDFDRHAYYLNCPNGVVDLRTAELMKPDPTWLCSKTTRVKYNPEADCPRWREFLEQTFQGNDGLLNFIQRWVGYSITADVGAQSFAIFYGIGANGKSTLCDTIQRIMGDYVSTAAPETFIQKKDGQSSVPNDIAALRGSRMVLSSETEANAKLAEAKVKSLTGGERISARYMRGEWFDINPTWKITMSTNHRPRISGGDYAIWRRIILVPFLNVVPPSEQNPKLVEELVRDEAEGIMKWAVLGAMNWYKAGGGRMGLQIPEAVYDETQEYREDEDVIGRFLALGCLSAAEISEEVRSGRLLRERAKGCHSTEVFYSFRAWAEKEGEEYYARLSQTTFGRAMRERGHVTERNSAGKFYSGIVPRVIVRAESQGGNYGRYDSEA